MVTVAGMTISRNTDFDVDLDVGLSHTRLRRLIHMMLIPNLDSRSPILMTWRDRAACLDEDPELFFPIGNNVSALLQIENAKAVCRRCEVVDSCMKWAIESRQDTGVWGGLSEDERRSLKRRDARARRAGPVASLL